MAFFKTKIEKEMMAEMKAEENLQTFNEQIANLNQKRQEYAKLAAQAEMNGDTNTYDVAVNALLQLNEIVSSLNQNKANYDLITISNSIAISMCKAVDALDSMASGQVQMPNLRKIQKTSLKINKYIKEITFNQKAMNRMMKTSNPANKTRTTEEVNSVRPMIEAEIAKMSGGVTAGLSGLKPTTTAAPKESSVSSELEELLNSEKKRII